MSVDRPERAISEDEYPIDKQQIKIIDFVPYWQNTARC